MEMQKPAGITLEPKSTLPLNQSLVWTVKQILPKKKGKNASVLSETRKQWTKFQANWGFSGYNNKQDTKQQSKPKKDKKKKDGNYPTIKCWFCSKTGHTQIECRQRKAQNKPLMWRNKEVTSKYHNKKIMAWATWQTLMKSKNGH